jgi:two-component system chemotaxis sensor kinase CheA/two-component system sensor histidine kinase and response regulator WspE
MSGRRESLLERFRARSLDRLRRLAGALEEVVAGQATDERWREIARDLHTLKGDATVVGMDRLAEVAHAAEELFLGARGTGLAMPPELRAGLGAVEDVLLRALSAEDSEPVLAPALEALRAVAQKLPPPGNSAPGPAPAPAGSGGKPPSPSEPAVPAAAAPAPEPQVAPRLAPSDPEAAAAVPAPPSRTAKWLQVRCDRIDQLCDTAAGLSSDFHALAAQVAALLEAIPPEKRRDVRGAREAFERCGATLEGLLDSAWTLRLVEVEPSLEELVAYARQLAASLGKRMHTVVRGNGAEVERGVLENLREPLLHLVRNAVDHGIESPEQRGQKDPVGQLLIEARAVGPHLALTVSDDGRGIDLDAVREEAVAQGRSDAERMSEAELHELLFAHGFSTRREVTAVSGRGVGLDVVRSSLLSLGGTVALHSMRGEGTRFELVVPSTLSRERCLVVESAGVLWGLPATAILEVQGLSEIERVEVAGGEAVRYRGQLLPLVSLSACLHGADASEPWVLIAQWGSHRVALRVGRVVGETELLRRPADRTLARLGPIAASAASADGRLVLLLSLELLLSMLSQASAVPVVAPAAMASRRRVLVVDDSATVRDLVCELLAEAGMEVRCAENGREGLSLLDEVSPEVVLSDIEMPVMDGFELLKEIRVRRPHLPVIMLTTRGSAEDRRRAATLGASAYLVKSEFEEATLLETLGRYLGGR